MADYLDHGGLTGFEPIADTERKEFLNQGFLLVRGALTEEHRRRLEQAVDRVSAEELAAGRGGPGDRAVHLLGFLTRDELFGQLLAHPTTFRYVWGLLGWNIYSHHNHLDVTPPAASGRSASGARGQAAGPSSTATAPEPPGWGWHQDGYRQNSDPETLDPGLARPMFSLKVAYVLSDLSEPGRGATKVLPGSHLHNTLARPGPPYPDPDGTVEVVAEPGDAFLFDRRLWHSRSPNQSAITRKLLFVGYTYRWVRPLDDMPIDRAGSWWASRTPVQRQLLGEATHTANYWGINWDGYIDEQIPLRQELRSRGLLDRAIPWLR